MPSGIFKTESRGPCLRACWKLTEIKLAKHESRHQATQGGSGEKREKSKRALLADGEKCCKLTNLFLKSSAASASTSANTASTNVSDTAEPAHQGERQDSEEYEQEEDEELDMDTEWWLDVALMICYFLFFFMHCCCAFEFTFTITGHQKCMLFTCVKNCACVRGPLVGGNARGIFCSQSVTDCSRTTTEVILSTLHWDYSTYLSTNLSKHYHHNCARGILR